VLILTGIEPRFLGGQECNLVVELPRCIYLTLRRSVSVDSILYVVVTSKKNHVWCKAFSVYCCFLLPMFSLPACHIHSSIVPKPENVPQAVTVSAHVFSP